MFLGYAFATDNHSLESTPSFSTSYNNISITGGIYDELYVSNDTSIPADTSIPQDWGYETCLHALFDGDLSAGNVSFYADEVSKILVKRRKVGTSNWVTLDVHEIDGVESMSFEFFDITARSREQYEYALVPVFGNIEGSTNSATISTEFDGMILCEKDATYISLLDANVISQRNKVVTTINTLNRKYPFIIDSGINNYENGTAKAVWMEYDPATDTWDMEAAYKYRSRLNDFLMDGKPKLLKMWDGRMWLVSISGAQIMQEQENVAFEKIVTSFEWTEIGDAENGEDLYINGITDSFE